MNVPSSKLTLFEFPPTKLTNGSTFWPGDICLTGMVSTVRPDSIVISVVRGSLSVCSFAPTLTVVGVEAAIVSEDTSLSSASMKNAQSAPTVRVASWSDWNSNVIGSV